MLFMKAITPVGKCDFCHKEGRYLEELNDKHGDHVMSKCLYGCDDYRSIPEDFVEEMELVSIEEIERSNSHDSKWKVIVKVGEEVSEINVTRYSTETEEALRKAVMDCRNRQQIDWLNKPVFHN
ncbi:hypothetical protein ACFVS2_20515 [Brevibacillus sp. NPDC058079]|uniref:hypothetical protein n=1 Tax=Brevibacillus sp. NPDC058079 TaxID=3346330 RepID=UPI0036E55048